MRLFRRRGRFSCWGEHDLAAIVDTEKHRDSTEKFQAIEEIDPAEEDSENPHVTGEPTEALAWHGALEPLDEDTDKRRDSGESTADSEEFRTRREIDPAGADKYPHLTREPAEAGTMKAQLMGGEPAADTEEPQD